MTFTEISSTPCRAPAFLDSDFDFRTYSHDDEGGYVDVMLMHLPFNLTEAAH